MANETLAAELTNDPLARGYAAMTDAQVAESLAVVDRPVERTTMRASEIFEAIVLSEYNALAAAKKAQVDRVLNLAGDDIPVGVTSKARAFMLDSFGAGSQTRTNLSALMTTTLSRAEELGLGTVSHTLVAKVRGG